MLGGSETLLAARRESAVKGKSGIWFGSHVDKVHLREASIQEVLAILCAGYQVLSENSNKEKTLKRLIHMKFAN